MVDRHYHVASLLIGVVVWIGENDTKKISVDANLFENGAKQLRFLLKTDHDCGRGHNLLFRLARPWEPCIRLALGKFKLTNQDSAGRKKFTVLASM